MSFFVLALENLLFPLGALAIVFRFLFSSRRRVLLSLNDELFERMGGLSAAGRAKLKGRRVLWVHAASAGEVAAVSRILERIKRGEDAPAVLMTCTTVTGREKAASLACVDAASLAPLDCYPAVAAFLRNASPQALMIVETELWPQTLALAGARGVKIGLVNGRMTDRSFSRYRALAPFFRPFVARIDRLAVQTEGDAEKYRRLGARPERIAVAGNMKYDGLKAAQPDAAVKKYLKDLGWEGEPVWVAGSTHAVEEEILLEAYRLIKILFPRLHLVLAPRHPERIAETKGALEAVNVSYCVWSQGPAPAEALLIDGLGVLPKLYAFADVSYVGGTLVPVGGHNLLEPAMAGAPVLFGPHTEHTREVARLLESTGCGFCCTDAPALASALGEILGDDARRRALGRQAREVADRLRGAVDKTLAHLGPLLS